MKNKLLIFTCILAVLTSCSPRVCEEPIPDYTYFMGEKAIHIPSGEKVRIINYWQSFGPCRYYMYNYNARFSDGADISYIHWTKLKPLTHKGVK